MAKIKFIIGGGVIVAVLAVLVAPVVPAQAHVIKLGVQNALSNVAGALAGKKTECLRGEVVKISKNGITVKYVNYNKKTKKRVFFTQVLGMTAKQFAVSNNRSIKKGSGVKLCSRDHFLTVLGNLVNLTPVVADDAGGGGGGGGGGGTAAAAAGGT